MQARTQSPFAALMTDQRVPELRKANFVTRSVGPLNFIRALVQSPQSKLCPKSKNKKTADIGPWTLDIGQPLDTFAKERIFGRLCS